MAYKAHIPASELAKFNAALGMYTDGLRKEANRTLLQHGRLLARDLVKWTAPPKGKPQGEAAVEHDVRNAVKPFDHTGIKDKALAKRLTDIEKQKDYVALNAIFKNVPRFKRAKAMPFSPELHEKVRLRGGRLKVPDDLGVYTLEKQDWKSYLREVKARVGKLKASWAPLYSQLQVAVPQWISRHNDYGNRVTECKITLGKKPSIVVRNGSRPMNFLRQAANTALAGRTRAMARDLAYKIKHMRTKVGA